MKKQVVVIGGGDVFASYKEYLNYLKNYKFDIRKLKIRRWKENLPESLGEGFEVIFLKMPNTLNAKYAEWKIMFEKLIPFLKNNPILLGHSLGGIFLAKYLSENRFSKKIKATFLVSAPFDHKEYKNETLGDFKLGKNLENLENLEKQGGKIFIYHSEDDNLVSFKDFLKYKDNLPKAETRIFKNRGHFDQQKFPEIVKDIKNLC
jgi:uncharacterized protein